MTDEMQTTAPAGAMAVPDFLKDVKDTRGTDHISKEDTQIPRLALMQSIMERVTNSDGTDGWRAGNFFNSVSEHIFGRVPITFFIIRGDRPRWVEFVPRNEGGGIRRMNVPEGDPATQFGPKGEPPIATKFYDFIIYILTVDGKPYVVENPMDAVIALSFKSTGIKTAKRLNTLIRYRGPKPLFAGNYVVTPVSTKNAKGTFFTYFVDNAGWAATEEEFKKRGELYDLFADKVVTVHTDERDADETGAGGSTDFPTDSATDM